MEIKALLLQSMVVITFICAGHSTLLDGTDDNNQTSPITVKKVEKALKNAKEINLLKRAIDTVGRDLNSKSAHQCPLSLHHGKRLPGDSEIYRKSNDALLAVRMLMEEDGFSVEDLQTDKAVNVFSRVEDLECIQPAPEECNFSSKYRTIDGSCNNIDNPNLGMVGVMQERIVANGYDDDLGMPRTKGLDGKPLPNARDISNHVHANTTRNEILSSVNTQHIMAFGQFLDHDIALTSESHVENCCENPDDQSCFNININKNDTVNDIFVEGYCMEFKRSAAVFCPDAQSKRRPLRQQINAITSFVDASNVYGSSESRNKQLRDEDKTFLLKTAFDANQFDSERIADAPNNDCKLTESGQNCPFAGDTRAGELPTLLTIQWLFAKEHNRIANILKDHYDDEEIIYQEARRILIAVMQRIVYDEFLASYFSPKALKQYKLLSSAKYKYKKSINPSLINSFGLAYRVGHSWIPQQMKLFSQDLMQNIPPDFSVNTEDSFFNPNMTYVPNGFARVAYALSGQGSPDTDNIIEESVRSFLFSNLNDGMAFDLAALNIQRGREHGLPSYNEYRKFCKLTPVKKEWATNENGNSGLVDHTNEIRKKMRKAGYGSPRDIDLYTGGVSETSVEGGILGPLFQCLIGEQFSRMKFGDRYWYQNKDAGFTEKQIKAVQEYSYAKILCNNYNFTKIQYPNAFLLNDPMLSCDDIPDLDLTVFFPVNNNFYCYGWTQADLVAMGPGRTVETERHHCEDNLGHVFTHGNNKNYPNCGTCWCCQRNLYSNYYCYGWTQKDLVAMGPGRTVETERHHCENNLGHVFTHGNNNNYPNCGMCWCCQRKVYNNFYCYGWTQDDLTAMGPGRTVETERRHCENNLGHVFTQGNNEDYPNCGTCWCCQRKMK